MHPGKPRRSRKFKGRLSRTRAMLMFANSASGLGSSSHGVKVIDIACLSTGRRTQTADAVQHIGERERVVNGPVLRSDKCCMLALRAPTRSVSPAGPGMIGVHY